ncbi:hypothetical protein ARALYDRAFT_901549 [Arabidopsis lyrata subsp. lyrata]|uniref:Uncharacterized protein n=1 Tax=Arabidopsis lyrata subsp. lyrata TaxID=81972 RepID=D7LFJ1_ARALL|nr:hypothetical protein ARALYDRAFT_901549 [Arabidopsis lyrata subsp. lyrata]
MALIQHALVSGTSAVRLSLSSSVSPPSSSPPPSRVSLQFQLEKKSCCRRMICRSMVQDAVQVIPSVYARENRASLC